MPGAYPHQNFWYVPDHMAGGDGAREGAGNQNGHTDNEHWILGHGRWCTLAASIIFDHITPLDAPLKIIGLKNGIPWICYGAPSDVIIRETSVVHAGTPNQSTHPLVLPSFRFQTSLAYHVWDGAYVNSRNAPASTWVSGPSFNHVIRHLRIPFRTRPPVPDFDDDEDEVQDWSDSGDLENVD